MSSGAGWAGLAGAANALVGQMNNQRDFQQKQQLDVLQQQAQQAREEFLIGLRGNTAVSTAQSKHDMTADDLGGTFTDKETGNVYGRTKNGPVLLNQTSDNYQADQMAQQDGKATSAGLTPQLQQARLNQMQAGTPATAAAAAAQQPVGGTGDPNDPMNSPQAQAIMKQATAEQWPEAKVTAALVQATGVQAQPPGKTVVRTGTDANGNKVAQFSDGSIGPAP